MAKLSLYAAGLTATFSIVLIAAAAEDADLLKQAQRIFQPLPKIWRLRSSDNQGTRRTREVAVFRSATDDRRQHELFELSPTGVLRYGRSTKTNGCQAASPSASRAPSSWPRAGLVRAGLVG
jgi:hypothetical protein